MIRIGLAKVLAPGVFEMEIPDCSCGDLERALNRFYLPWGVLVRQSLGDGQDYGVHFIR